MHRSPSRPRIVALDILRGYFLSAIIVDHLGLFPNVFEIVTGRGILWASAAEGFFIISGLLVGYLYGPKILNDARGVTGKLWKRAAKLYACSVALTTVFVVWGNRVPYEKIKPGLWWRPELGEYLSKALTMRYSYGWADFLPYYVLFLFIAPLAIYVCAMRKAWLVTLVSVAFWVSRGSNFTLGWQIYFFGGLVAGYYLPTIETWWRERSETLRKRSRTILYSSAATTMAFSWVMILYAPKIAANTAHYAGWSSALHLVFSSLNGLSQHIWPEFNKWAVPAPRIAVVVLYFSALYVFVRSNEVRINRMTGHVLAGLGQHSLYVYGLHAIVVFGLQLILPKGLHGIEGTLITGGAILAVYMLARGNSVAARRVKSNKRTEWRRAFSWGDS